MLKLRITFVDDKKGNKELDKIVSLLDENMNLVNQSKVYAGRGKSKYSSIYLDMEVDKE